MMLYNTYIMEIPKGRIDIEALRQQYAETQPLVESRCDPRDEFIVETLFGDTYERLGEGEFPKKNGLGSLRLYRGFVGGEELPGRLYIAVLLDTDGDTYKLEQEGIELDVDFVYLPERTVRDDWGDGDELLGLTRLARHYSIYHVPGPGPSAFEGLSAGSDAELVTELEQNSFDSKETSLTVFYRDIFADKIAKHRQQLQEESTTEG
jgi:hypothetical protein